MAYDYLHEVNAVFDHVVWDEEAAEALCTNHEVLGLPELIASCVHLQEPREGEGEVNARQEGPADAQVDGREADDGTGAQRSTLQEGEQEEGEYCALSLIHS